MDRQKAEIEELGKRFDAEDAAIRDPEGPP
jgi:hypothetical protein